MTVEIFINGDDYLNINLNRYLKKKGSFADSLAKIIEERHPDNKNLFLQKAAEIDQINKLCQTQEIVNILDRHLTLDVDFAEKLKMFDIIHCPCLKPKSELGEVIKELMIDEYQLVLTERRWLETDSMTLSFEAVEYGEASTFISDVFKGKVEYL